MKNKHFYVWAAPIAVFVIIEALEYFHWRNLWGIYALLLAAVIAVVWSVIGIAGIKKTAEFFLIVTTPVFLAIGTFLFLLFLESWWLPQIIALFTSIMIGIYLENIYLRRYNPEKYQEYSLANISSFMNLFLFYEISAALFGFIVFLRFEVWAASLIIIAIAFFITHQNLWIVSPDFTKNWLYIIIVPFVAGELFWVMNFLPSSIYVNAFILAVMYYIVMGLAKNQVLRIINRRIFFRYAYIGGISLVVVLATAKWA